MTLYCRGLLVLLISSVVVTSAFAQSAPTPGPVSSSIQKETPEQRQLRLGTTEDPGPDPDPNKVWLRFGKQYTIEKFPIAKAAFDSRPGFVRPLAFINIEREIYRQDETQRRREVASDTATPTAKINGTP